MNSMASHDKLMHVWTGTSECWRDVPQLDAASVLLSAVTPQPVVLGIVIRRLMKLYVLFSAPWRVQSVVDCTLPGFLETKLCFALVCVVGRSFAGTNMTVHSRLAATELS